MKIRMNVASETCLARTTRCAAVFAAALAVGAGLSASAVAQTAGTGQEAPPEAQEAPDATARKVAQQRAQMNAKRLIQQMQAAYKAAPALKEVIIVRSSMGRPEETVEIAFGPGTDMRMANRHNEITSVDGHVFVTFRAFPEKYLELDLVNDPVDTLLAAFGRMGGVKIAPVMRFGKGMDLILDAFGLEVNEPMSVSGYRETTNVANEPREQITLISANSSVTINVDPATKFVTDAHVDQLMADAPVGNLRMTRDVEFATTVFAELPEPIAFDPAGRDRARTLAQVRSVVGEGTVERMTVKVGDEIPDHTLHTLKGKKVVLSEQRGTCVVLVFWATWNPASREGLPGVADWVRSLEKTDGLAPVSVYGVNTMPRGRAHSDVWEKAYDLWENGNFPMDSFIDPSGAFAKLLGIDGIPLVVVMDSSGRLAGASAGLGAESITATAETVKRVRASNTE